MIDANKFNFPNEHKNYLVPQVLTNVNHNMSFMTEETFGPCVGIMKVKDDNEAIKLIDVKFDSTVTAEEVGFYKPHPEMYNCILKKIKMVCLLLE